MQKPAPTQPAASACTATPVDGRRVADPAQRLFHFLGIRSGARKTSHQLTHTDQAQEVETSDSRARSQCASETSGRRGR
jgi:hypothetical protein